ncbi:hypothetical protein MKZ38_009913 [Zalerion maritima]|uniref:Uncharacterized protein n=1 Tax=Zalerion maritima TaxID=339359 RepID=A0AAD5RTS0_9PEZI|nr:hypothetical protein MKZ38_009913 [Zalerion maritima]
MDRGSHGQGRGGRRRSSSSIASNKSSAAGGLSRGTNQNNQSIQTDQNLHISNSDQVANNGSQGLILLTTHSPTPTNSANSNLPPPQEPHHHNQPTPPPLPPTTAVDASSSSVLHSHWPLSASSHHSEAIQQHHPGSSNSHTAHLASSLSGLPATSTSSTCNSPPLGAAALPSKISSSALKSTTPGATSTPAAHLPPHSRPLAAFPSDPTPVNNNAHQSTDTGAITSGNTAANIFPVPSAAPPHQAAKATSTPTTSGPASVDSHSPKPKPLPVAFSSAIINHITYTPPPPPDQSSSASDSMPRRKRSKPADEAGTPAAGSPAAEDANTKGGHSLRKRARIDYALKDDPMAEELAQISNGSAFTGRVTRKKRGAALAASSSNAAAADHTEEDDREGLSQSPLQKKSQHNAKDSTAPQEVKEESPRARRPRRRAAAVIKSFEERSEPSDSESEDDEPQQQQQQQQQPPPPPQTQAAPTKTRPAGKAASHRRNQSGPHGSQSRGHRLVQPAPPGTSVLQQAPGPPLAPAPPPGSTQDYGYPPPYGHYYQPPPLQPRMEQRMEPRMEPRTEYRIDNRIDHRMENPPPHALREIAPMPPETTVDIIHMALLHLILMGLLLNTTINSRTTHTIPKAHLHYQAHHPMDRLLHRRSIHTITIFPPRAHHMDIPDRAILLMDQPQGLLRIARLRDPLRLRSRHKEPLLVGIRQVLLHAPLHARFLVFFPKIDTKGFVKALLQALPQALPKAPLKVRLRGTRACRDSAEHEAPPSPKKETKSLIVTLSTGRRKGKRRGVTLPHRTVVPQVPQPIPDIAQHDAPIEASATETAQRESPVREASATETAEHDDSTTPSVPESEAKPSRPKDDFLIDVFSHSVEDVEAWAENVQREIGSEAVAEARMASVVEDEDLMEGIETDATSSSSIHLFRGLSTYLDENKRFPKDSTPTPEGTQTVKSKQRVASRLEELQNKNGDDDDISSQFDVSRAASPNPSVQLSTAPSPSATGEGASKRQERRYVFKKLRDSDEFSDFVESLGDLDKADDDDLYRAGESLVANLHEMQQEHSRLKLIIDDEANAVRRQAQEESLARAEANGRRYPRRDHKFELKGARKPRTDEPHIAKQKEQDRIQADAYFFQYDPRDSMVGIQNPLAQREGLGSARLRNRPKMSVRAAEADDSAVGKRTRRPREFLDQAPEPPTRRSGRPKKPKNLDDEPEEQQPPPASQPKTRRGKRARVSTEEPDEPPVRRPATPQPPASSQATIPEIQEPPVDGRKRKRGPGRPPGSANKPKVAKEKMPEEGAGFTTAAERAAADSNAPKRRRIALKNTNNSAPAAPSGHHGLSGPMSPGSFYGASRTNGYAAQAEDSRPGSSSSNATMKSTGSYELRPNRQRTYVDAPDTSAIDGPDKRGGRRRRKKDGGAEAPKLPIAIAPHPGPGMANHTSTFPVQPVAAPSFPTQTLSSGGPAPQSSHLIIKLRRRSQGDAAAASNGCPPPAAAPVNTPSSTTSINPPQVPPMPQQQQQQASHQSPFVFVDPSVNLTSIKSKPKVGLGGAGLPEIGPNTPEQTEESLTPGQKQLLLCLTEEVCREVFKDRSSVPLKAKLVVATELGGRDYFQLDKGRKMSISMKLRWALGEMSEPQARRTATMARKKAAKATEGGSAPIAPAPAPIPPLVAAAPKAVYDPVADAAAVPPVPMSGGNGGMSHIPSPSYPPMPSSTAHAMHHGMGPGQIQGHGRVDSTVGGGLMRQQQQPQPGRLGPKPKGKKPGGKKAITGMGSYGDGLGEGEI